MITRKQQAPHKKKHISKHELLRLLEIGIEILISVSCSNQLRIMREWTYGKYPREVRPYNDYHKSSIDRTLTRLFRKGYIEVREREGGIVVIISKRGKKEILRYDINSMEIPVPHRWDGKWRMVFYDIPTGREQRHPFTKKLNQLGFFRMQRSVYVHPYPCYREIEYLREVYELPHWIKLATIDQLENDEDLRAYFHLI